MHRMTTIGTIKREQEIFMKIFELCLRQVKICLESSKEVIDNLIIIASGNVWHIQGAQVNLCDWSTSAWMVGIW